METARIPILDDADWNHLVDGGTEGVSIRHYRILDGIDILFNRLERKSISYTGHIPGRLIQVNYCTAGSYLVSLSDGSRVALASGDVALNLSSRVREEGTSLLPTAHYEGLSLLIDPALAAASLKAFLPSLKDDLEALAKSLETAGQSVVIYHDSRSEGIVRALDEDLAESDMMAARLAVVDLILLLRTEGHRKRDFSPLALRRVSECHSYILSHPAGGDGIKALSSRFALSSTLLRSCFKAVYGLPLGLFIRQTRLSHAAQLLAEDSSLSIGEVASRVGYANHSRFASAFRRLYGLTPSEYRRSVAG